MSWWRSVSLLLPLAATPAILSAQSGMTAAQARQLYGASGFPISADGKNPTNRCGQAANPRITFVDMNGDGRKEALFIDAGACYQPDGRWYAVATQGPDGNWRKILDGAGAVAAAGTQANGWFVLNATSGGKTQKLIYDGTRYAAGTATAVAPPVPAPAPKPGAPAAAKPSAAAPATGSARDIAIFRAAGFTQKKGKWESSNCPEPHEASYAPGAIEQVQDFNGDGRPDAIVTEGGGICYGNTGQAFWLVSQQADGNWTLLTTEIGIPEFLKTKGAGGWPDLQIGGPGFCFPVWRWNGTAYVPNRKEYEGKRC